MGFPKWNPVMVQISESERLLLARGKYQAPVSAMPYRYYRLIMSRVSLPARLTTRKVNASLAA